IVENRSREYIEKRLRAGLLEQNTVDLMHDLGVAERLDRQGLTHDGIYLRRMGETIHIEIAKLTGRHVTIYGHQEVVKDMVAAWIERGGEISFEVEDTAVHDIDGERPRIAYASSDGERRELECDFIAGCDGFHGICRPAVPSSVLTEHHYEY